jgi:hypothetical protein
VGSASDDPTSLASALNPRALDDAPESYSPVCAFLWGKGNRKRCGCLLLFTQ